MFRYSVMVTSLTLIWFSLLSVRIVEWAPNLWASDEPAHSGMQTHLSPGMEVPMPDWWIVVQIAGGILFGMLVLGALTR